MDYLLFLGLFFASPMASAITAWVMSGDFWLAAVVAGVWFALLFSLSVLFVLIARILALLN